MEDDATYLLWAYLSLIRVSPLLLVILDLTADVSMKLLILAFVRQKLELSEVSLALVLKKSLLVSLMILPSSGYCSEIIFAVSLIISLCIRAFFLGDLAALSLIFSLPNTPLSSS